MVRTSLILTAVTLPACFTTGEQKWNRLCDAHEIVGGLGPSDDPGLGFTMGESIAYVDAIERVDAVPAAELGGATQTLDADIEVTLLSDVRYVMYGATSGSDVGCLGGEGLQADVVVRVDLGTLLHAEVHTTANALQGEWAWFGYDYGGNIPFDTLELDPEVEAAILSYALPDCTTLPTTVSGEMGNAFSEFGVLFALRTERCSHTTWPDYLVWRHTDEPLDTDTGR